MTTAIDDKIILRSLVDIAFDGVAICTDHVITEASPSFCSIFGLSSVELVGRDIRDLVALPGQTAMSLAFSFDMVRPFEVSGVRADGSLVPLEIVVKHSSCNGVAARVVAARGISERKEYEERLRISEEKFHQLADNINEAFWIISADLQEIVYLSKAAEAIWGKPISELQRTPKHFFDTATGGNLAIIKTNGRGELESKLVRSDGTERWVRSRWTGLYDRTGSLFRVVGLTEDITVSKEREDLIQSQNLELAKSARMAAVGKMAAGIAHEVNTPLAEISLRSSQLSRLADRQGIDLATFKDFANRIHTAAARISKITSGLIELAHDRGQEPPIAVPIVTIVQNAATFCKERFAHRQVALSVPEVPADAAIFCRRLQIEQVIVHLLNNALDAVSTLQDKWVKIEVIIGKDHCEISVTDSGWLPPGDVRKSLFLPFFTTKDVGAGTGLNLSISKSVVEEQDGSLTFDETSDHTRFVLKMRRAASAPTQKAG